MSAKPSHHYISCQVINTLRDKVYLMAISQMSNPEHSPSTTSVGNMSIDYWETDAATKAAGGLIFANP